jgi:hypothetical protein
MFIPIYTYVYTNIYIYIYRLMKQHVKDIHEVDNIWELMRTPGYVEHVGLNNVYKSEMNSSHSCNDKFLESVRKLCTYMCIYMCMYMYMYMYI